MCTDFDLSLFALEREPSSVCVWCVCGCACTHIHYSIYAQRPLEKFYWAHPIAHTHTRARALSYTRSHTHAHTDTIPSGHGTLRERTSGGRPIAHAHSWVGVVAGNPWPTYTAQVPLLSRCVCVYVCVCKCVSCAQLPLSDI